MNVIGLGKAGCTIAKELSNYPQYDCYMIDDEIESGDRSYKFPKCDHPEEYEAKTPNLKKFFKSVDEEVLFIVCGASRIAGASLKILNQIKDCKITVLYIKPNLDRLTDIKEKMHNVCFGVFQEYARSAVFERMIIVDNDVVEDVVGDLPIIGYYDVLNQMIVNVIHMLNVLKNSEPVIGKINEIKDTCRISTIGVVDFESGEEKKLFSIDNVREKCYFYLLKREDLTSSGKLLKTISNQVEEMREPNSRSSFAIYSSDYDDNFIFSSYHTPYIQGVTL